MYRTAIEALYRWKSNPNKKPLIIRGARQVGKTWLMKEFGRTVYEETVYINFDNNRRMKELFSIDLDIKRLIAGIELYAGHKINPAATLLIFDEVQEVPAALTSLKYFNENADEYQIICAGSMLGIALHPGTSFPVGKVEFLDLYPISFSEFMLAMEKDHYVDLLNKKDYTMAAVFRHEYIDLLKQYYFVGGMPEAVLSFFAEHEFNYVRDIQNRILAAYEQDFSKHAQNEAVPRIRMLWNSIPAQLAKENKKFLYGLIKEGARAREYEYVLMWLIDCGLVNKVHRVTVPKIPLKIYENMKAFKLFIVDVGLLSCMSQLRQDIILDGNAFFTEFKGALTEQYVRQQLRTVSGINTYYWTNERNTNEIDFLLGIKNLIIPLEVKAETNLQSKSLKSYEEKYQPRLSVRTSMSDYRHDGWLLNLPLYAIEYIARAIDDIV